MKATAILNNYQMGSYPHRVMKDLITKEERIDPYHTQVTWEGLTKGDFDLLRRVIRNIKIVE